METKGHIKEVVLCYALSFILGLTGDGMNNLVYYLSVFVTLNQVKLTGAVLYGVDTLVIGDCG